NATATAVSSPAAVITTASSKLPFSLGGQAVSISRLSAQPAAVSHRIVPTHVSDWHPATAPTIITWFTAACGITERVVLFISHLILTNAITTESYRMSGFRIKLAVIGSHLKATSGYTHHLGNRHSRFFRRFLFFTLRSRQTLLLETLRL